MILKDADGSANHARLQTNGRTRVDKAQVNPPSSRLYPKHMVYKHM